jgi:hypothetical protein
MDHEDRTPNALELFDNRDTRGEFRIAVGPSDDLGGGVVAPRDRVLDPLGRVRLAEDIAEEELQPVVPVLEPVMRIPSFPTLVRRTRGPEISKGLLSLFWRPLDRRVNRTAHEHETRSPSWITRRDVDRAEARR